MVTVENIRDWRGKKVVDRDGEEIGELVEVYYDVETDREAFALVKDGLLGRHHYLAPLDDASASREHLRVRWTRDTVTGLELDEDALSPADERELYGHYGLRYEPPGNRSGRRLGRR